MEIIFIISLFIVAYLYASVGHGGASGYLALMALYGLAPEVMRPSALILNLFVSLIAFIFFLKGGFFRWRLFLPFIIASIPLSFLGASFDISPGIYRKILALCLLIATLRMVLPQNSVDAATKSPKLFISLLSGGIIGLVSGLIGIGGGIILSPLLIINKWANIKETACISAAFIFFNSTAGLAGLYTSHSLNISNHLVAWIIASFIGGLIGSYMGAYKISSKWLRYILSFILVMASVKLFLL